MTHSYRVSLSQFHDLALHIEVHQILSGGSGSQKVTLEMTDWIQQLNGVCRDNLGKKDGPDARNQALYMIECLCKWLVDSQRGANMLALEKHCSIAHCDQTASTYRNNGNNNCCVRPAENGNLEVQTRLLSAF